MYFPSHNFFENDDIFINNVISVKDAKELR
jgi:hypothetical protein